MAGGNVRVRVARLRTADDLDVATRSADLGEVNRVAYFVHDFWTGRCGNSCVRSDTRQCQAKRGCNKCNEERATHGKASVETVPHSRRSGRR